MPKGKGGSFFSLPSDRVLAAALVVSLCLHLIPIFGLSFVEPASPGLSSLKVVQVKLSQDNPDPADFLATQAQRGSGSEAQAEQITQDTAPLETAEQIESSDLQNQPAQLQSAEEYLQRYLHTTLSIKKQSEADNDDPSSEEGGADESSPQQIQAQIAQLEKQYASVNQVLAKIKKTKIVTSQMSTKADPTADFMLAFTERVERVGNEHLPQMAREQEITGEVRLMVIVSSDGQVKAIRLLKSSGSRLLDRYAKQTVRYAAPFEAFTPEMDAEELRIIRTWRFAQGASPLKVEADAI